jgi:hypothetical protein
LANDKGRFLKLWFLANSLKYLCADSKVKHDKRIIYLGLYYLLDLDYPASHELGFTLLHYLFFQDETTPGDIVQTFNATLAAFQNIRKVTNEDCDKTLLVSLSK